MNKTDAKKIAETITFSQLQEMFNNAKANITDWTVVSNVNKQMTKGTAWNILFKGLNPEITLHKLAIKNMIWEFGDHLPEELKIKKQTKEKSIVNLTHQEPRF
tara:strand:- start:281 stop:589 length:309 start_codon:yes stop_codon:yes gene_type:complete